MDTLLLDTHRVKTLRKSRGVSLKWLLEHIGVNEHTGRKICQDGVLPKDAAIRKKFLSGLAAYFGVTQETLLLTTKRMRSKKLIA